MAKKETHVAPKVQSRKEWIAAVEDGTKTKQQAIARCKAMVAKYEARGGTKHGDLWAKWLAELEGKPKAKAKAKPKAVATFTKPKASAKTKAKPLSIQVADEVELAAMKIMLAQLRAK